jgi:murein L,D-transpeptidase YcbB/YkuD
MTSVRILVLILTASFPPVFAESPSSDCESALCRLVASGSLSTLRWPDFSDYRTRIQKFYEPVSYTLAWIRDGLVTDQAKTAIQTLQEADAKGLNSQDYDGPRWDDRLTRLRYAGKPLSESDFAEFDLALTVCVTRYIADLHFGRANPGLFHAHLDAENGELDLPSFLRQRVIHATDAKAALEGVEPPYEGYRRTKQALQQYIAMAREDHGGLLPVTIKPLEPGGSYTALAQLASLLRRIGDLPGNVRVPLASNTYADPLVDAVKHFQRRHGLEPDGRLGKATLAQLNTPLSYRVRQLQLTLERWRWAPHNFPHPPIVVNIPEFELRVLNDSYETELEMKVVVGKAYRHQTPVFAADLKEVIFRPYWNVPRSIQRTELVPKLDRDASYLAKNGYEVVTPQDAVVTNAVLDGATLAQLRSGKLRIRQVPGPENALGLVKFLFPNEHNVYLHATPATELFSKSRRDFSHGCIRVEKPQQLAAWVLRGQPEWTPERIASAMNGAKTIQVTLDRPIPVLIVYATAVVLQSGEARFFEDIYGQDDQLEELLAKGYPSPAWKATSAARGPRPRE